LKMKLKSGKGKATICSKTHPTRLLQRAWHGLVGHKPSTRGANGGIRARRYVVVRSPALATMASAGKPAAPPLRKREAVAIAVGHFALKPPGEARGTEKETALFTPSRPNHTCSASLTGNGKSTKISPTAADLIYGAMPRPGVPRFGWSAMLPPERARTAPPNGTPPKKLCIPDQPSLDRRRGLPSLDQPDQTSGRGSALK